jgi:hypothetical protein
MMSPTNRFIAVLYTVFGLMILAVAFLAPNPRLLFLFQIVIATGAIFVAVQGVFRRDIAALVVAAGLGSLAVDAFAPNPIFRYLGFVLFLGGFYLLTRRHKTTTTTTPQAGV